MNIFMKNQLTAASLILGVTCVGVQATLAEDWPTFRGADRDAISSDVGLLDSWAEGGPKLLWTAEGAGRGYASPVIAGGKVYTLGDGPSSANDKDEYLTCFDAATGNQVWMSKTGPAWNEGRDSWQGSRSTPTVDGNMVYVVTPHGKLVAARTSDGNIAWTRDLKADFGGKKKDIWGYSESPLVDGNLVVVTPGGPDNTVVAMNKMTGEEIWSCSRPDDVGAGHSSIVVANVGGTKTYIQNTGGGPLCVDAESGALLWDYDMEPPTAFIPTPVLSGDHVLIVAGYGQGGGVLLRLSKDAQGQVKADEVYGLNSGLRNKHGGVIVSDGHIYGGSQDKNIVFCANLMTGEKLWEERGAGSGSTSVVAADGKLIARFQNGTVALAKLTTEGYDEVSSFTTPGSGDRNMPSWAHPVIANGKLFLREGNSILCYDISKS